jgi:hypothetical protein
LARLRSDITTRHLVCGGRTIVRCRGEEFCFYQCRTVRSLSFRLVVQIEADSGNTTVGLGSNISKWNSMIPQYAKQFSNNHSDASVALWDVHSLYMTVLSNPTAYGFRDNITICHTSSCIWADGVHSTFAMHQIVATNLLKFLGNATISSYSSRASPPCSINYTLQFLVFALVVFLAPRCWVRGGRRRVDDELGLHRYTRQQKL